MEETGAIEQAQEDLGRVIESLRRLDAKIAELSQQDLKFSSDVAELRVRWQVVKDRLGRLHQERTVAEQERSKLMKVIDGVD